MKNRKDTYRQRAYDHYRSTAAANPLISSRMSFTSKVRQNRQRWRRFLPHDKNASIPDLGCGSGEFLYFLQEEGYNHLYGVDISPEQVKAAQALKLENVEQGDVREYVQQHMEMFDVIAAFSLLEHLERDEMLELLDGVVQALRPRGLFLAVMPNSKSFFSARVRYGDITHEQSFTPKSIVQICAIVGLEPVAILERGPLVHGIVSMFRWIVWQMIRGFILFYLVAESGDYRWRVYTQDICLVAKIME